MIRTWLIAIVILGALAGGIALIWKATHTDNVSAPARSVQMAVSAATVTRQDLPFVIQAVGTVVANESVAVKSRIDSQIMEVKFHDGDKINKGDVLFVLDRRLLETQLQQTEANLVRDKALLEDLRLKFERAKDLKQKGYETVANYDAAKSAFDAQQAVSGNSEAAIKSTRVQLDYTRIVAPISGRAGTISLTEGNVVKANDTQPLVIINQISPIRVQASIPQQFLHTVRDAMGARQLAVTAMGDNGQEMGTGIVQYVDNQIDQVTGTFAVRATFPNESEKLWPGMFVTLRIVFDTQKNIVAIPDHTVQHSQAGDFVFVIKDGKAMQTPVKVARTLNGLSVIAAGLEGGETIVTDGFLALKDGTAVSVRDNTPANAAPAP